MCAVSAARLVLLLVAGAVVSQQQCVPGEKKTSGPDCVAQGNCPDDTCICIPSFYCDRVTQIGEGSTIVTQRITSNDDCQDIMETCCPKALIKKQAPAIGQNTVQGKTPPATGRFSCGQRHRNGVSPQSPKPAAGEAGFGEFPWTVALLNITNGVEKMIGGGALIHQRVVMTAAHTVHRYKTTPSLLLVRAGEWNIQSTAEEFQYQQVEVREVIIHKRYNRFTLNNDIALVVLRDPVELRPNTGLICLPAQDSEADNTKCIVTGWGADSFGQPGCFRQVLKSVVLPSVSRARCQEMFRQTPLGESFRLHESFMCAGGEAGVDACVGDGGGPLVCPIAGDEEFYELAGVTSWGIGCGQQNIPGAYTQVSRYLDWVDETFIDLKLPTEGYRRTTYII